MATLLTVALRPPALPQNLKPLLEKRRRARINESLSQLKGLVLPMLGAEVSVWEFGKLERRVLGAQRGEWACVGPGLRGDPKTCVWSARWSGRDHRATGEHLGARTRCSTARFILGCLSCLTWRRLLALRSWRRRTSWK